jgi:hypothetical protein
MAQVFVVPQILKYVTGQGKDLKEWNNMLSEKELRELAADIIRKIGEARKEGDDEKAKHLMNAYSLVVSLLAEMEEKKRMWEQFLGDIKRVVEEPPRREGEEEEKIEERREFARRLYEIAERGLKEEGILLRKNPVCEAIRAIRSALRKATIELDPENFREAALETKKKILQKIDEALSRLDEYKAAFENLTPEQVDFSEPKELGVASARKLQQAHIHAAERVKTILGMARKEFEQEGLVKLTDETDMHLRYWTGEGADFAASLSYFVNRFVKDEETERRLRDIALKVDAALGWIGTFYRHYKQYLQQYEELSKLPPGERPKIEVGWWPGVWEEVKEKIKRQIGGGS